MPHHTVSSKDADRRKTPFVSRGCSAMASSVTGVILCIMVLAANGPVACAQTGASEDTVPASIIVSVAAKHGKEVPTIYREDVRVLQEHERVRVADWVPLRDDQAGLDLFLVIDDATDPGIGAQFDDLKKFIHEQPSTTRIAIGYMHFGYVEVKQQFTADHARASKALRLPMASGSISSPYLALTDLIEHWPESLNRRIIFMISSGTDALQPGPNNMYLDETVEKAQRAGIQIYSIYAATAGRLGGTLSEYGWGQNNLLQVAGETGGEAYFQGLRTPLSFGPYLDEFSDRLNHQFKLTFLANAARSGLRKVRVETEVPNTKLSVAERIYIPEH
jgi:hypothetical protein